MRNGCCDDLVKEFWLTKEISNFGDVARGMQQCGYQLMRWNMEVFGKVGVSIKKKEDELRKIMSEVEGTRIQMPLIDVEES